jgi:hypothetical protein
VRRRFDLFDQLLGDLEQPIGRQGGRLLDEVDGAGVEGGQHLFPGTAGDADHQDRHRPNRHLPADEGDPVHLRHVEVAGDDVWLELGHQLERLGAVAGSTDDIDERTAGEHLLEYLPHICGIVHYDYAHELGHRRASFPEVFLM